MTKILRQPIFTPYFNNPSFSDVTFLVKTNALPATPLLLHKIILAPQSRYFNKVFLSEPLIVSYEFNFENEDSSLAFQNLIKSAYAGTNWIEFAKMSTEQLFAYLTLIGKYDFWRYTYLIDIILRYINLTADNLDKFKKIFLTEFAENVSAREKAVVKIAQSLLILDAKELTPESRRLYVDTYLNTLRNSYDNELIGLSEYTLRLTQLLDSLYINEDRSTFDKWVAEIFRVAPDANWFVIQRYLENKYDEELKLDYHDYLDNYIFDILLNEATTDEMLTQQLQEFLDYVYSKEVDRSIDNLSETQLTALQNLINYIYEYTSTARWNDIKRFIEEKYPVTIDLS